VHSCDVFCSYHSPRRNRARPYSYPSKVQTKLSFPTKAQSNPSFASSKSNSAARNQPAVPSYHRSASDAATDDSREWPNIPPKLAFCALTDVKPTCIFANNHVRSWSRLRAAAWQDRLNDIHRYMMHLPFPHEATGTILHVSQQWARCESDRLLAIIDKCIQ
jgi:hypothetical protein